MQWYKHDTDAASDAKVKKLLLRHGAVGYAIYFHCLELIAADISESNITFQLEHDAEIIADNLKIRGDTNTSGIDIVNQVMLYIVDLGLFENRDGRITCMKLLKRLDSSMTSNQKMRKIITSAKGNTSRRMIESPKSHGAVMTGSCKIRSEETRSEEKREEKSNVGLKPNGTPQKLIDATESVITCLNEKAGTSYRASGAGNIDKIRKLLKRGYSVEDMRKVAAIKAYQWKDDPKMRQYLRPSTLFGPEKFDDYLGEYEAEVMKDGER